ncbi:hypothetical protein [Halalkalibacter hemicellulosilyticus]|uniref:Uncharacterized protein n=1 Tax=Halalkalibacter hemicellulosilyticusJCM 9152 TaxID=1236971 RepID=W4QMN4_9BACI|nr:hypothetical protein [Halalkalibacter hemicellulosilyticus]GAE32599.1 hypothetical protein JCM9152_4138 [Halalkalibacter hemicellulosilyticusJCM 9152]
MLHGKTHDLEETKGSIIFYYGLITFIALIGAGLLFGAFLMEDTVGSISMYVLAAFILFLSVVLLKKMKSVNKYLAYGIDEERQVLWEAQMQKGVSDPLTSIEIPFHAITIVLLAPYQVMHTYRTSHSTTTKYSDNPVILVVFKDGNQKLYHMISFKSNEDTNFWLNSAIAAGLQLDITDEAINKVITLPDAPDLIENGVYKQKLYFNGTITAYFNPNQRNDHRRHEYTPNTKEAVDFSSFVLFPIKPWHVIVLQLFLFYSIYWIEAEFFGINKFHSPYFLTIYGLIAAYAIIIGGYLLFNYSMKKSSYKVNIVYFFIGFFMFFFVENPANESMDPLLISYLMGVAIGSVGSHFLRQKKPALHHVEVEQLKERMRYQSEIDKEA